MSDLVVGIDGGGTRTVAAVWDADAAELARIEGGAGIINPADPSACAGHLATLTRKAIAAADRFPPAGVVCCALAGAGRAQERDAVQAELEREQVARRVMIITDAEAALVDAFGDGPGLLLIAGTGSIAWGRTADGRVARVGGWGAMLGDEGSGYALGRGALRGVAAAEDGRAPATILRAAVLTRAGLDEPEELIRWAAQANKRDIGAIGTDVLAAAAAGDTLAQTLLEEAAAELAQHVEVLARQLGPWSEPPPLALAGGLLRADSEMRRRVTAALPDFAVLERQIDAARGAARCALRTI